MLSLFFFADFIKFIDKKFCIASENGTIALDMDEIEDIVFYD